MIITKGTVLVPTENKHHGSQRFVVDCFDVGEGFTRILDKDGWWIGDFELNMHYRIEEPQSPEGQERTEG